VFGSWYADKATSYRRIEGIPDDLGTAVNVQRMVFGNLNDESATGVAFSRNPNNGAKEVYGDFLVNAQGEDVVAGTHDTSPLSDIHTAFPTVGQELDAILETLERELRDMVDIEFTIEDGKLYMLQARVGKRNPQAAVKIATEMLSEGLIELDESKARIDKAHENWTEPTEDDESIPTGDLIGNGLPASPGRVSGIVALSSQTAVSMAESGKNVILVRYATDPSDIEGMSKSVGILTQTGGLVSHAAVVARGWGKSCVVGANIITSVGKFQTQGGVTINEGESIVIDGTTGEVWMSA
jgi:pyruvate,orthophosphate dikinase